MKFVTIQELKKRTKDLVEQSLKETVIVTEGGKPKAVLQPLLQDELMDYLLENDPDFQKSIREAWEDYQAHGGINIDELIAGMERDLEKI